MSKSCGILVLLILFAVAGTKGEVKHGNGGVVQGGGLESRERIAARKSTAQVYHGSAMDRINDNDYQGALPFFHLACRLDSSNAVYWNDLGVTEMRLGELNNAKTRFLKAVDIDPAFSVPYENIEVLKTHMGEEEFNRGLKKTKEGAPVATEHHVEEPPEMDANEFFALSVEDDVDNSAILGTGPIIVRGAAKAWKWSLDKTTLDDLRKHFGNERVDYYPHNMKVHTVHPYFSPLDEAIEALETPTNIFQGVDVSEPGTYIQWNVQEMTWRRLLALGNLRLPPVFDDLHWAKKCFNTTQDHNKFNVNVHWKMVLIGEAGAGMFNHKDVLRMASWQVQLAGRKKWHICSPTQDEFLSVEMNVLYPDYNTWPQLRNASCFTTIVGPGDMLYYPRDWWHQTENLDTPTIALSGSIVNKHNYVEFTEELRKECSEDESASERNRIFLREPGACGDIERCASYWSNMYTKGVDEL